MPLPIPLPPIGPLDTPRLVLRALQDDDLADLLDVNGDPEVTRFLPYAAWRSMADAQAWLARTRAAEADGGARQLVVVARDGGRVIGSVLLFRYEQPSARIELGYVLGRRHWGGGLMREALLAVCGHAFDALAIRRMEAQVNPDNLASNALLLALGFVAEGTLRQRWVNQGRAVDTNFYGLLAEDWKSARASPVPAASEPAPVAVTAADVPPRRKPSNYPEPFASMMAGREKRALGDAFGLVHFGVNLTRLAPHAVSALRHAHARQDEFVYVLQGHPTLDTDAGATVLGPGQCAGFRAGTGNAHRLRNDTDQDVIYLEVGDRTPGDAAVYPDDDLTARWADGRWQFSHQDGTPYD